MRETIAAQTVILKDDVHLPEDVKVETEPYTSGWKVVKIWTLMDSIAPFMPPDGPFSAWPTR